MRVCVDIHIVDGEDPNAIQRAVRQSSNRVAVNKTCVCYKHIEVTSIDTLVGGAFGTQFNAVARDW